MKHIKTFEGYVESLSEGLSPAKMKEVIAAVAESLAGQLDDEGMEASEVEDFLEENPNAAESTLEGMEDEYGVDLVSLWPKMKAEVIKKVQEILDENADTGSGEDVNEDNSIRTMMIQAGTQDETVDVLKKAGIHVKLSQPPAYGGDYEIEFKTDKEAEKGEEILSKHFGE